VILDAGNGLDRHDDATVSAPANVMTSAAARHSGRTYRVPNDVVILLTAHASTRVPSGSP
jgi:hypothetical protein